MNNLKKCICKDCLSIARWQPAVVVKIENDNLFKLDFNMPLCDNHKEKFKLDDIIPDSSLKSIQAIFSAKFIHPPTKNNMSLEWKKITIELVNEFGKVIDETELKHLGLPS